MECQYDSAIFNELTDEQKKAVSECLYSVFSTRTNEAATEMLSNPNYFDTFWMKKPKASYDTQYNFESSIMKTPAIQSNDTQFMTINTTLRGSETIETQPIKTLPNNVGIHSAFLNIEQKERDAYQVLFECKGVGATGVSAKKYLEIQEQQIKKLEGNITAILHVIKKLIDFRKENAIDKGEQSRIDREVKRLEESYNLNVENRKTIIRTFEQSCLQFEKNHALFVNNRTQVNILKTEMNNIITGIKATLKQSDKEKLNVQGWETTRDLVTLITSKTKSWKSKIPIIKHFIKDMNYVDAYIKLKKQYEELKLYENLVVTNLFTYEKKIVSCEKKLPIDYKPENPESQPYKKYNDLYKLAQKTINALNHEKDNKVVLIKSIRDAAAIVEVIAPAVEAEGQSAAASEEKATTAVAEGAPTVVEQQADLADPETQAVLAVAAEASVAEGASVAEEASVAVEAPAAEASVAVEVPAAEASVAVEVPAAVESSVAEAAPSEEHEHQDGGMYELVYSMDDENRYEYQTGGNPTEPLRTKTLIELEQKRTELMDACKGAELKFLQNEKQAIHDINTQRMQSLYDKMQYESIVKETLSYDYRHIYNCIVGFPKRYGNHFLIGECSNEPYDLEFEMPAQTLNHETRIVVPSFESFLTLVNYNFTNDDKLSVVDLHT
jgi:hypothetical protein